MLRYFDVPGFGEGGTVAFAAFSVLGHVDALAATARQDYCSHERNDDNSDMLFHVLLTRLPFIYFGCPKKNVKKEYTSAKMRRLAESVEMTETADALRHSAPETEVYIVGDAVTPGNLGPAIKSAFTAAVHI